MMMKNNSEDHFLADWMAGKMTDDELRLKVSPDDFQAYLHLRQSLATVELPAPDFDRNFAAIKVKKAKALDNTAASKAIPIFRYAAIAAEILMLIGLFNTLVFTNRSATRFGEQATVLLDDASTVSLNANSRISYPNLFVLNRAIRLEGEAFFEVSKGKTFTVKTSQGEVTVLGTKFDIVARDGFFEVVCYEGRVKVCSGTTEKVLAKGQAVRFDDRVESWQASGNKPRWTSGESEFHKTPFREVMASLENQYGKEISFPAAVQNLRYTGSFTHRDLDKALQSVCIPMQLRYTKSNGKIIISE